MIKQLKTLAPVTVLSMALMMTASPVLADFSVGNSGTGAESDNEIGVEIDRDLEYLDINNQDVDNEFPISINTGDNGSEFGDGSEIETGDIDLTGEFENDLNANVFEESNDFDPSGEVFNDFTGFDSDNSAFVVWNLPIDILNSNLVDLDNLGQILANTGYNESSFNLGFSLLGTGDADLEIDGENVLNANFSELEDFTGADEITVGNENTGPLSDNEAFVEIDTEIDIDNINDADIDNDLYVSANTGGNCVEFNSGDCDCFGGGCSCGDDGLLATGDAAIGLDLINQANENATSILSSMGLGDIIALNSNTGFGSDNEAEVEIDSDIDVESNNDADIDNDIDLYANTGYNDMEFNSGSHGSIETGDASSEVAIENRVNSNSTEIDMDMGGDISVINECTGAESDNEAEADIDLELDIDNENDADIDNDINIGTNTGYNSSEFNDFGDCDDCGSDGWLQTGNADASVNIENQVNANVTELSNFGDLDIIAENSGTGYCSDNETTVNYSNSVDITNRNYADINNDVTINANTGGNVSGFNGGSGINTGNSSVTFGVSNGGNTNIVNGD